MIELISVEVENFRSFGHATFTPLGMGQGMTAINGANGTGKSSLATHAIMWALYGVTPDGVPVRAMRKQGSTGEVRATVVFRHQGQDVSVSRMLKGKNDTTVARILVDGVEQTNVAARTAASWVTRRLGVDAEGFSTAFVVKQKEVDALVRARPAERRALIERLAGIHHMSAALAKSREAMRNAQSRLEAFGPVPDVEALEEALKAGGASLEATRTRAEEAEAEAAEATERHEVASSRADEIDALERRIASLRSETEIINERIRTAQEEESRLRATVGAASLLPDAQAALREAEGEVTRLEAIVRAAAPLVDEATRRQTEVESIENAIKELEQELAKTESRINELSVASDKTNGVVDEIASIEDELNGALGTLGALSATEERLTTSIGLLHSSHEGDAECPTCRGSIVDPVRLAGEMEVERQQIVGQREELLARRESLEGRLAALKRQKSERDTQLAQLSALAEKIQGLQTRIDSSRQSLIEAEERAESTAENAHGALIEKQQAEESLPAARNEAEAARRALHKAEVAIEAEGRIREVNEGIQNHEAQLETLKTELKSLMDNLGGNSSDSARSEVQTLLAQSMRLSVAANEAKTAMLLAERDFQDLERNLSEAERIKESVSAAKQQVEYAQALAEALDEFRRDRIARLAPELAEVASDLLATMTEGRYTSLDLDEDFTPIVTESATGLERPTSWLSGGEESSVALALRIAIGEVVAGQRGGLLVLDEVLTAQDQLRRNATMAAIRTLPRQVVTINHVSEATDLVDLVAQVIADGESGSRVEQRAIETEGVDPSKVDELIG